MRFRDRELESAFRKDYDLASLGRLRVAGALAITLYAAFGYLDVRAVDGRFWPLWIIRIVIVVYFGALIALSYTRLTEYLQQLGLCVAVVVAAGGLDVMNILPGVPSDYTYSGTMLILIFLCTFARVRFTMVLPTLAVVIVAYEASEAVRGVSELTLTFNNFFLLAFVIIGLASCHALESLYRDGYRREIALAEERARSDALLHNILPEEVAARLRATPGTIADAAEHVTVLFADVVGFTPLASRVTPAELVAMLDQLFTVIDELCARHGVEKIKTIGDAYMAVAGVPREVPDHAAVIAELALEIRALATEDAGAWPRGLQVRIGICSGPVVAGVIGRHKFSYDLWGDTVNTAARMESHGTPGEIQVAESTRDLLGDRYRFTDPVVVDVKGKGPMTTYLLIDRTS